MTQPTKNILFQSPDKQLLCAFYDETYKVTHIFNWGAADQPNAVPKFIKSLPNKNDAITQYAYVTRNTTASDVAPNGIQNSLMAVSTKFLQTYFLLY